MPVTIPRAERYAVHKLIVAVERQDQAQAAKEVLQAATLIGALAARRPIELAKAWATAWDGGPRWKEILEAGWERLPEAAQTALADALARAVAARRRKM